MPSPYTGPRPFERADKRNFYGREREVEELLDLLLAERIVLLYSPSGAGKSSLLAAGLVPRLEEHFRPLPIMRVSRRPPPQWKEVVRGANRYVLSLLLCLEDGLPPETQRLEPARLVGFRLTEYLKERYDFAGDNESHVLILDQLEEVLTLLPTDQLGVRASMAPGDQERLLEADRQAKQEFFVQLGAALRNRRRWAIFALREDYIASLDAYLSAIPTRLANTYRLNLLDREEALEAVRRPAAGVRVEFTQAAAAKLVDDLREMRMIGPTGLVRVPGPHVEPVQLQVVCLSLWEKLRPEPGRVIDLSDLDVLGEVDNALMAYYAETVGKVASVLKVRERTVRDWFDRHLITVQGRRGQVLQGDPSQTVPDEVVAELVNRHLVREDRRAGATWFELAHDRLIDPVRKSNDAWRREHLPPLQRMALIWDAKDRPPDNFLLRHQELTEAEAWAETHDEEMGEVDRAFLRACQEHRRRGEEKKRYEKLASYIKAGIFFGILAVGVIAALILLWQRAHYNEWVAEQRGIELEGKTADAVKASSQANRALRVVRAEKFAWLAHGKVGLDPEFSVFLALEGLRSLDDVENEPEIDASEQKAIEHARTVLRSALNEGVPRTRVKFTLLGHSGEVNALTYSPDGNLIATASDDGTARLWDARNGESIQTLDSHRDHPVNAVAFGEGGKILATASEDKKVRLWRPTEGNQYKQHDVLEHASPVNAVAFSHDGRLLAAGTEDGAVVVWEVSSLSRLPHEIRHNKKVNAVAFHPRKANRLATASDDETVKVWDPDSGELRRTLYHKAAVTALAFKPDGNQLATASEDMAVHLWYADSGQIRDVLLGRFQGASGNVRALAFHLDDKLNWLAAGLRDSQVKVWEANNSQVAHTLAGHQSMVTGVAFRSKESRELATSSDDWTVKVWDLSSRQQSQLQAGLTGWPSRVSFNADGKYVAASGTGGWATVWSIGTGREVLNLPTGHRLAVRGVAFSGDGKHLLTGSDDANARIWETDSGRELFLLAGHTHAITAVAYRPDGQQVATASVDNTARVWDAKSGKQLFLLPYPTGHWPQAIAYSGDGKLIATAGSDGVARIWDGVNGQELYSLAAHPPSAVTSVAFSPRGRRLITGSADGGARIWELEEGAGKEVGSLAISRSPSGVRPSLPYAVPVTAVAYSSDEKVAGCGGDGIVHVWDAATGEELLRLSSRALSAVAFSPDGKRLATASWDRTACVWDLDSGTELKILAGHTLGISAIAFEPGGGPLLATASEDRTIRLWDATQFSLKRTLGGWVPEVNTLALSPKGGVLAVARANMTTVLVEAARSHEPRDLSVVLEDFWLPTPSYLGALNTLCPKRGHNANVLSLAFSPDGERVLTGSGDGTAKLWEVTTGRLLGTCTDKNGNTLHKGAVTSVAFSPKGMYIATGGQDRTVRIWHGGTGRWLFDVTGQTDKDRHINSVIALAFSPNEQYLATGSQDRTVKIWNVSSAEAARQRPRNFTDYDGAVYTLAFSPKGEHLAAVVQNGTVKVLNVKSDKEFLYLGDRAANVYPWSNLIAFKDDHRLLVVDASRTVREYLLDLDKLRELAEQRISPPEQREKMKRDLEELR